MRWIFVDCDPFGGRFRVPVQEDPSGHSVIIHGGEYTRIKVI